jgi:hypothetical protein
MGIACVLDLCFLIHDAFEIVMFFAIGFEIPSPGVCWTIFSIRPEPSSSNLYSTQSALRQTPRLPEDDSEGL